MENLKKLWAVKMVKKVKVNIWRCFDTPFSFSKIKMNRWQSVYETISINFWAGRDWPTCSMFPTRSLHENKLRIKVDFPYLFVLHQVIMLLSLFTFGFSSELWTKIENLRIQFLEDFQNNQLFLAIEFEFLIYLVPINNAKILILLNNPKISQKFL